MISLLNFILSLVIHFASCIYFTIPVIVLSLFALVNTLARKKVVL